MTTRKSIKESIINKFNIVPKDANWYATRYYNFLKVKREVKADTYVDEDIITMQWSNGQYKIKAHDHIDRAIMIPLLINTKH
jgi:hypothetical protein